MNERTIRHVAEFLALHPGASVLEIRVALALRPGEVYAALDRLVGAEEAVA